MASKGFTLLETLMALLIAAISAAFFTGFLFSQMDLYYDYDRKAQAKAMCGEAYVKLEEILRYGYVYYCNEREPEELAYYIREKEPAAVKGERAVHSEIMFEAEAPSYEVLPRVDTWPRLRAEDLGVSEMGAMKLRLDFSGTTVREVQVSIQVLMEEKVIYKQDTVIDSLYEYQVIREGVR